MYFSIISKLPARTFTLSSPWILAHDLMSVLSLVYSSMYTDVTCYVLQAIYLKHACIFFRAGDKKGQVLAGQKLDRAL